MHTVIKIGLFCQITSEILRHFPSVGYKANCFLCIKRRSVLMLDFLTAYQISWIHNYDLITARLGF